MNHRIRQAFTLIEMLVVVALLALLIALLVPALHTARELAVTTKCVSQLHQWAITFQMYGGDYGGIIPGPVGWANCTNGWPGYYCPGPSGVTGYRGGNYVANNSPMMRCPKQTSGSYGEYAVYGAGSSDNDIASGLMINTGVAGYGTAFRPALNPYAADFLMLADSSAGQGPWPQANLSDGTNCFLPYMFWSGGSWGCQGMWLAHQLGAIGETGGLFADGHAEHCGPFRLVNTKNFLQVGTHISGLKTWKQWNGLCTTDGGITYNW
jgi:prepilin-type N-terminal cleavage/methylation domain-containing protein